MKTYLATPEGKAQRSAAMKAQWEDPVYRAKRSTAMKARLATPEGQAQQRAAAEARRKQAQSKREAGEG